MCVYFVASMYAGRIGVGWAHNVFTFACHMFMHFSYIRTNYVSIFSILNYLVLFCLSLSLSFFLLLVALWHLCENLPHPRALFIPRHLTMILLLHTIGSVMIKPVRTFRRTFHDMAFVRNTKSSYWIFPILTFPLSSIVRVGSHCVASRSLALLWSYKSFTPTCTDLNTLYLSLSLAFRVRAL